MNNKELKIKLWALTGLLTTLISNGHDTGITLEEQILLLNKSLNTYKDSDSIEDLFEARNLIQELYKEVMGENTNENTKLN